MADTELRGASFVREHAGLVGSGLYLAATLIGMLSSWTFFQQFDINVFHYAQLGDFLLAAVRTPLATLAVLLAIPAVWVVITLDNWLSQRSRFYRSLYVSEAFWRWTRSPTAMLLYFISYAFVFAVLHADWLGDRVRTGDTTRVSVQLQSGTYLGRDATRPFDTVLLGTTTSFVFLYDRATETSTVVPLENLAALAPLPRTGSAP